MSVRGVAEERQGSGSAQAGRRRNFGRKLRNLDIWGGRGRGQAFAAARFGGHLNVRVCLAGRNPKNPSPQKTGPGSQTPSQNFGRISGVLQEGFAEAFA